MKTGKKIVLLLQLISILIMFTLLIIMPKRAGLENIWILPLVYAVACYLFRNIFEYQKGGLAIKLCIIIETIRFLVLPLLIGLSNGEISIIRMSFVERTYYTQALIIQCIELFVFWGIINIMYPIYYNKLYTRKNITIENINNSNRISIIGWIIFGVFLAFLAIRFNIWFPALKIFGIKESSSETSVVFEKTIFSCCNILILAYLVTKTKSYPYKSKKYIIGLIVTIIWTLFNSLSYFGTNRVYVLESIIASFVVVIRAFPQNKKIIQITTIPLAISLVFMMIVTKQFNIDSTSQFNTNELTVKYISNTVEEYVNGPWCIAQTIKAAQPLNIEIRYQSFGRDLSKGFAGIADLPIIKSIYQYTENWKSSSEIMKASFEKYDRGQMLSFSGNMFICFGDILGWGAMIILNAIFAIIIVKVDFKSRNTKNIYYEYIYVWMSILFGLSHCYCLETVLYCWSKLALIYLIFLKLNSLGLKKSGCELYEV